MTQEKVDPNDLIASQVDDPIEFTAALGRAMKGTPNSSDLAPRSDFVLVRRITGQIERVPLLDWHRHQLERHKAMQPTNPDWQAFQETRFKAIVEERISLNAEIEMFVLRPQATH